MGEKESRQGRERGRDGELEFGWGLGQWRKPDAETRRKPDQETGGKKAFAQIGVLRER